MRMARTPLLALVLLAAGCAGAPPPATPGGAAAPGGAERAAPDQLLVGVRPGVTPEQAAALWTPLGGRLLERLRGLDVYLIAVPPERLEAIARALRARPEVSFVERNRLHGPAGG
jgi:hypothetical protein